MRPQGQARRQLSGKSNHGELQLRAGRRKDSFVGDTLMSGYFELDSKRAWPFFPISSNESAANSALHGPPKSRQVSFFIKNLIPCSFRNADTFSFVRSVIRPVYVEVACFEFASDGMIRSIR